MLRNSPDDLFRIVAAGKRAFRESPVVFGLAGGGARRRLAFDAVVVVMTRGVLRIDMQFEVAKMVGLSGLSAGLDIEVRAVLFVGETRQAQDTGRIGGGGISTELTRHGMQEI